MRIGLIAQPGDGVYAPNQNSIGLILFHTACALARREDVVLVSRARGEPPPIADFGFRSEMVASRIDDWFVDSVGKYPRWSSRLGLVSIADEHRPYARVAARAVDLADCDVAHVMNYWQWVPTLRRRERPVVLEMQSEWLSQIKSRRVGQALASADAVVGVSDHISGLFRNAYPDYPGVVATAYNGVDADVFVPRSDEQDATAAQSPVVLFVGRLSPEKAVHVLVQAFAEVKSAVPAARLELVGPRTELPYRLLAGLSEDPALRALDRFYAGGPGSYQRWLDDEVDRLGLREAVTFAGSLSHTELVARYRRAAVLVNPSLSESFGISIVEGMAARIPVVGARVGGMKETILHDKTGLLVDPNDASALADAIVRVLTCPEEARRFAGAGRARAVEEFSWGARADRLLRVYQRVVGAK